MASKDYLTDVWANIDLPSIFLVIGFSLIVTSCIYNNRIIVESNNEKEMVEKEIIKLMVEEGYELEEIEKVVKD